MVRSQTAGWQALKGPPAARYVEGCSTGVTTEELGSETLRCISGYREVTALYKTGQGVETSKE